MELRVESQIPNGGGLGSSAAYSLALCGAVTKAFLHIADAVEKLSEFDIGAYAFQLESLIHGKSSGADVKACLMGGVIKFWRDESAEVQTKQLTFKDFPFLVINTNKSSSTQETVAKVRKMKEERPDDFEFSMGAIKDTTEMIEETLSGEGPLDSMELCELISML